MTEATNYAAAVGYLAKFVEFREGFKDMTTEAIIAEIDHNIVEIIKQRAHGPPH